MNIKEKLDIFRDALEKAVKEKSPDATVTVMNPQVQSFQATTFTQPVADIVIYDPLKQKESTYCIMMGQDGISYAPVFEK